MLVAPEEDDALEDSAAEGSPLGLPGADDAGAGVALEGGAAVVLADGDEDVGEEPASGALAPKICTRATAISAATAKLAPTIHQRLLFTVTTAHLLSCASVDLA